MKKYIIGLLLINIFSSCATTGYIAQLASPSKEVKQVENGDFLYDTDSLWIAYSFRGANAPVQITIFNKSHQDIYIDWSRSELATQKMIYSYSPEITNIGEFYSTEFLPEIFDNTGQPAKGMKGLMENSKDISAIPPGYMLSYLPLSMLGLDLTRTIDKDYTTTLLKGDDGKEYEIKEVEYEAINSPLLFRSTITIFSDNERPKSYFSDFFMSKFIKTNKFPVDNPPAPLKDRGNLFYVEKQYNNYGYTISGGGTFVIGVE